MTEVGDTSDSGRCATHNQNPGPRIRQQTSRKERRTFLLFRPIFKIANVYTTVQSTPSPTTKPDYNANSIVGPTVGLPPHYPHRSLNHQQPALPYDFTYFSHATCVMSVIAHGARQARSLSLKLRLGHPPIRGTSLPNLLSRRYCTCLGRILACIHRDSTIHCEARYSKHDGLVARLGEFQCDDDG